MPLAGDAGCWEKQFGGQSDIAQRIANSVQLRIRNLRRAEQRTVAAEEKSVNTSQVWKIETENDSSETDHSVQKREKRHKLRFVPLRARIITGD